MTTDQAKKLISRHERGQVTDKELHLSLYQDNITGNARREIINYLLKKEDKQ